MSVPTKSTGLIMLQHNLSVEVCLDGNPEQHYSDNSPAPPMPFNVPANEQRI